MSDKRKTPPFAKRALMLKRAGAKPTNTVWIHVGIKAWESAKIRNQAFEDKVLQHFVLPSDEDPQAFEWPVKDNDAIIDQSSTVEGAKMKELVEQLLLQGARLVILIRPDFQTSFHYPGEVV